MPNPFFDINVKLSETLPPDRVYALLDQVDGQVFYMEALDADWFDRQPRAPGRGIEWATLFASAPISVLQIAETTFTRSLPSPLSNLRSQFDFDQLSDEWPRQWFEILIDPDLAGGESIYLNLFGPAIAIGIKEIGHASPSVSQQLDKIVDLTPYEKDEKTITGRLLNLNTRVEWIGVYDVGQGSANGICDSQGLPLAYFDLGGGVLRHAPTFPGTFTNICVTKNPPVILSHWDWDHWSSGNRFASALNLDWIVPNQHMGVVHSAFAMSLLPHHLFVWPAGLNTLKVGQLTIHKCTGPAGRNHTGLAVTVDGPPGKSPILLTGDARYSVIPVGLASVQSVVVPHHGADMKNKAVPSYPGNASARAVYSYGLPNWFGHPNATTYSNHQNAHWPHRAFASLAAVDRHTVDLRPQLGHVGLCWTSGVTAPTMPCGGSCSLQINQT